MGFNVQKQLFLTQPCEGDGPYGEGGTTADWYQHPPEQLCLTAGSIDRIPLGLSRRHEPGKIHQHQAEFSIGPGRGHPTINDVVVVS